MRLTRKTDTAESAGDEALMLARRTMLPVLVGKKRSESIQRGIRDFGIDVAIFDDGFQVRNVHKDVELLILDGQAPRIGPASCFLWVFCGNPLKW